MRRLLLMLVFGATALPASAYALQDFDTCVVVLMEGNPGTVDRVREVPMPVDPHAFDAGVLQHKAQPETAEEVTVRLDTGPVVILTRREPHRLQAGERVRVLLNGSIARIERESGCQRRLDRLATHISP